MGCLSWKAKNVENLLHLVQYIYKCQNFQVGPNLLSQYIREAYGHKERKGRPGLPENQKKLYQSFRFLYFQLYVIVAFIFQRLYMLLIRIKYVSLPSENSYNLYVLHT